jgi:hypothetical protein
LNTTSNSRYSRYLWRFIGEEAQDILRKVAKWADAVEEFSLIAVTTPIYLYRTAEVSAGMAVCQRVVRILVMLSPTLRSNFQSFLPALLDDFEDDPAPRLAVSCEACRYGTRPYCICEVHSSTLVNVHLLAAMS